MTVTCIHLSDEKYDVPFLRVPSFYIRYEWNSREKKIKLTETVSEQCKISVRA